MYILIYTNIIYNTYIYIFKHTFMLSASAELRQNMRVIHNKYYDDMP